MNYCSYWRDLYNPDPDYFDASEFYVILPKAQVKANWQKYVDTQRLYYKKGDDYILVTNEKIVESYLSPDGSTVMFKNVPKYTYDNSLTYYTDKENVGCYQYDSTKNPPYQALKFYDNLIDVKNIPTNVQLCYPNFNRVGFLQQLYILDMYNNLLLHQYNTFHHYLVPILNKKNHHNKRNYLLYYIRLNY